MASLTVENYVKAIFKIALAENDQRATTGRLASALGVSPGTVTSMLKALSENGLVTYTPYEGVRLTAEGSQLALQILRRHRLMELFLTTSLGMGWDEVHDDAERLEHVVSDRLIERIDDHLGHPRFDPHGDPIPTADGHMPTRHTPALADCPVATEFRLARVVDQSPEFLRYLTECGIGLGARGRVVTHHLEAGVTTIELEGRELALGREATRKLLVAVDAEAEEPNQPPTLSGPHFTEPRPSSSSAPFDERARRP